MKIQKGLIFLFLIFLLCISVGAQDDTFKLVEGTRTPYYIEQIGKASASLTTLKCSFKQQKTIAVLSENVISKGNLLYKKADKLCWEYVSPYYYLFALNGDKVYIKNEKSTSQFDTKSNALFKEISLLLVSSISGAALIDPKKFDVSFFDNSTAVKMQLKPKNKTLKSLLSTITLYFEKTNYLVHSIEMIEPLGDATIIVFSEVELNKPVSDEKFVVR
jgi:outer membrane lipoprotein carrier protein